MAGYKQAAKKNPFVEGMANFRDFAQYRFRFTAKNVVPLFTMVVLFPAAIAAGTGFTSSKQDERFARDFPNRVRPATHESH